MAKVKCNRCMTNCIGCNGGKCKCGMKTSQVQVYNNFITEYPLTLEQDIELVNLLKDGLPYLIIKGIIVDGKTEEEIMEIKSELRQDKLNNKSADLSRFGVCVYPVGSARLGQWAECVYCSQAKFYNKGQKCPALNNNEGEGTETADANE